jgi:hypothetical protein
MVALCGLRQLAVRGRLDLEAAVTRLQPRARIIVPDIGGLPLGDIASAIDRGLYLNVLAQAPDAFDDGVGCVDIVDDDGNAGAAGNDDIEAAASKSRRGQSDQKGCKRQSAHGRIPVVRNAT